MPECTCYNHAALQPLSIALSMYMSIEYDHGVGSGSLARSIVRNVDLTIDLLRTPRAVPRECHSQKRSRCSTLSRPNVRVSQNSVPRRWSTTNKLPKESFRVATSVGRMVTDKSRQHRTLNHSNFHKAQSGPVIHLRSREILRVTHIAIVNRERTGRTWCPFAILYYKVNELNNSPRQS